MASKFPGGVWPAVLTPVDGDENVHFDALDQLVDLFVEQNLGGLYILGSTGQGPALSLETRKAVAAHVAKRNAGRLTLMVHVGATSTNDSVKLAEHAGECGADAISSVPPIYYSVDTDQTFAHYERIAGATDLPFLPYHLHGSAAVPPAAEYAKRLKQLPNFAGMKLTEQNYFLFTLLRHHLGDDATLFSGSDELMTCGLASGADGAIGSYMNLFGPAFVRVFEAYHSGDFQLARQFQSVFAVFISETLARKGMQYAVIIKAMKFKYGIDIPRGRTINHNPIYDVDDDYVHDWVRKIDAAAGL